MLKLLRPIKYCKFVCACVWVCAVWVRHSVCPSRTSYCNPRNVRHILLPSLSHATITKHARHNRKTFNLGVCMSHFATCTNPNCMVCVIACNLGSRSTFTHANASDARKRMRTRAKFARIRTRSRAFERVRSHANAKTWGCACRNLRHAQPQVFAHVGARSTHANACDRAPSWPWRTLAIVRVELGEHWRAFNARVGTRWRFT